MAKRHEEKKSQKLTNSLPGREWVIDKLVIIVEESFANEKSNLSVTIRALELIGKYLGMFKDKKDAKDKDIWTEKVLSFAKKRKSI